MMRGLSTKVYSDTELSDINELIKKYFSEWHPDAILKSNEIYYDPLAIDINNYFKNHKKSKKDIITAGYICDIFYGSSNSKKKSIKKINAIGEYINWAFHAGKNGKDEEVRRERKNPIKHYAEENEEDLQENSADSKKLLILKNCGNHKFYYCYYYATVDFLIKFAVIGFDEEKKKREWGNGKIYYVDKVNSSFLVSKIFELQKIKQSGSVNKNYVFYKGTYEERVNLFTITVNGIKEEDRGMMFLTYSAIEMQGRVSSAGIGLLEKIDTNLFTERLNSLLETGINPDIINVLFGKKLILKDRNSLVHKPGGDFYNDQNKSLNRVTGFWKGFYLRNGLGGHDERDELENGGLVSFYMHVERSGIVTMYYEQEDENFRGDIPFKCYTGFVKFPFHELSLMKGKLEYLEDCKMYKLNFWLEFEKTSKEGNYSYSGILSGWINKGHKLFTAPIFMTKIKMGDSLKDKSIVEQINNILGVEKPFRLKKDDLKDFQGIDDLKTKFKNYEDQYLSFSDNCL